MQPLTAPPRSGLSAEQVRELLTAEGVQRGFGCDVQYRGTGPWVDVSEFVHAPWTVSHDNTAEIHGSLSIELTKPFAWGVDRFRPWMTLSLPGRTVLVPKQVWVLGETWNADTLTGQWGSGTTPWTDGTLDGTAVDGDGALTLAEGSSSGTWTSPAVDLSRIRAVSSTAVLYAPLPTATDFSLDGGATWQPVDDGQIPGISDGEDLTGKSLLTRLTLSTGSDPVPYVSWTIQQVPGGALGHYETQPVPVPFSARFDAGVYLLSTPTTTHGRDPMVYQCSGKDLLTRAARQVGDTYVAAKGTSYLTALTDVCEAVGLPAPLLDGSARDTTLPADRVWALSANPRWLDVANDLMAEIAYTDLYMSPDGVPRAEPMLATDKRPEEWTFDAGDAFTDLIAGDFSEAWDLWAAPNQWRFVRSNLAYQPTEGDGIYTVTNQSDGPSSVDSVGSNPAPTQWLDVADQAALEAEGDRIVAADRRADRSFSVRVDPLPVAWHRDVVRLVADFQSVKTQVTQWELSPHGKGSWTLGGGPGGEPADPVSVSATATVTQASPLRVVVDGATVDSPAVALADDSGAVPSYDVGSRVRVQVQNPQPPLVQGTETDLGEAT